MADRDAFVLWFDDLGADDVARVGGKNASLGEMISSLQGEGIRVPDGFATTAGAYRAFLARERARGRDPGAGRRADRARRASLEETGRRDPRRSSTGASCPAEAGGGDPSRLPGAGGGVRREHCDVAVRSSATAEDLPEASFAGQQETFLNVRGERRAPGGLPALLRLALHRPRDRVPRRARLRPHAGGALGGGAEDGALRPRGRRGDVHARHRDAASADVVVDQRRLGARARAWSRGASTRTSTTSSSPRWTARASAPSCRSDWARRSTSWSTRGGREPTRAQRRPCRARSARASSSRTTRSLTLARWACAWRI